MISRSIIEDYKNIFILCLEVAGEKTKDKFLTNVEKNLDIDLVYTIIDDLKSRGRKVIMGDVICILLSSLLIPKIFDMACGSSGDFDMNVSPDSLTSLPKKIKKVSEEAAILYKDYLKIASEKFCKERGIDLKVDFSNVSKSGLINL